LLLDNLEQLTAGTAVLGELIAECPDVTLLVTSREPLLLAGEQQYEVPVLERVDAVELFITRAHAVKPTIEVGADIAERICERLDCLPLAIELAAARTKALSPAEILARLDTRLPLLTGGPRDAPRRQRTLSATID
jgi:predicted ATPase